MNISADSTHNFNESSYNVSFDVRYGNSTSEVRKVVMSLLIPAVMFGCGVVGNALALIVLARSPKRHRKSIFYMLVGGLAVTDLFGTLATSPVVLLVYENGLKWVGGQPLCDYFSFMMIFAGFATVFIVGAMAFDRYVSIIHPFFYDAHLSPKKAPYILLVIWTVAVVIACLPLIGLGRNVNHFPGTWCFFDFYGTSQTDKAYTYFYAGTGLITLLATSVLNGVVIVVLFKMRKNMMKINITNQKNGRKMNTRELQMTFFLIGIVIILGICWAPLLIRVIINQSGLSKPNYQADLLVIRLASFNQILDPWVYILLRTKSIIRVLCFPKVIAKSFRQEQFSSSNMNGNIEKNQINCLLEQYRETSHTTPATKSNSESPCGYNRNTHDGKRWICPFFKGSADGFKKCSTTEQMCLQSGLDTIDKSLALQETVM